MVEAEGRASAIRAQGEAEAEIIFKKGDAEARAMNVKAEAFQEYNQAAVVDKLITGLPEIVKALASPLANVDKITIVSTGNGSSAGMHKITGDITEMAAQVPALFEAFRVCRCRTCWARSGRSAISRPSRIICHRLMKAKRRPQVLGNSWYVCGNAHSFENREWVGHREFNPQRQLMADSRKGVRYGITRSCSNPGSGEPE